MSRTAYFHIGAGKTGTSAIQVALVRNRQLLADYGLLYPESHSDALASQGLITSGNGNLLADILWRTDANQPAAKQRIKRLLDQYPEHSLVYSSERIVTCDIDRFAELSELFRTNGVNVKIIYYVRHLMDYAVSLYGQSVKRAGAALDFTNWIGRYRSNYQTVLQDYSRVVGKENLVVRLYDQERHDLLNGFFRIVLGPSWKSEERPLTTAGDETVNRSLTLDETRIMLLVNGLLAEHDGDLARKLSKQISDKLVYEQKEAASDAVVTAEELDILRNNNAHVPSYVNEFVGGAFELKFIGENIMVGARPEIKWSDRDQVFIRVTKTLIDQLTQKPRSGPVQSNDNRRQAKIVFRAGLLAERDGRYEEAVQCFARAMTMDATHQQAKLRHQKLTKRLA
jgi:hypothetical protein